MAHLFNQCPRCGAPLNLERPALNAVSRFDNSTYICSPCGQLEALWALANKSGDLPGFDQSLSTEA